MRLTERDKEQLSIAIDVIAHGSLITDETFDKLDVDKTNGDILQKCRNIIYEMIVKAATPEVEEAEQ